MFPLRPIACPRISAWPCLLYSIPGPQKLVAGHLVSASTVAGGCCCQQPSWQRETEHAHPSPGCPGIVRAIMTSTAVILFTGKETMQGAPCAQSLLHSLTGSPDQLKNPIATWHMFKQNSDEPNLKSCPKLHGVKMERIAAIPPSMASPFRNWSSLLCGPGCRQ